MHVCVLVFFVLLHSHATESTKTMKINRLDYGDVIKCEGVLAQKRQPFALYLKQNQATVAALYIQGHRGQIILRIPNRKITKSFEAIRPGMRFRVDMRKTNKEVASSDITVYFMGEQFATIRWESDNHPNNVAIGGAHESASLSTYDWISEILQQNRECGHRQRTIPVPRALCPREVTPARIVGGSPADGGQHPWQVAIRYLPRMDKEYPHACGGTLIDSCWVLTATHCMEGLRPEKKFYVRVGDYYNRDDRAKTYRAYENSEDFNIVSVFNHPGYWTKPSTRNDIAIIRLEERSRGICATLGNFVQPACIPTISMDFAGCVVSGWGAANYKDSAQLFPPCLQQATMTLVNERDCKREFSTTEGERILSTMLCATGEDGASVDTCQGDSGGPLVCYSTSSSRDQYFISGITSWGDDCGKKPGVYTKVAEYWTWMDAYWYELHLKDLINSV